MTTPLGKDVLLLTGFRGQEAISQLFNFQVDLLAESKNEIHFDRIIGQNVTVEMGLPNEEKRYFNGLVKRFSQGARDEVFVHFHRNEEAHRKRMEELNRPSPPLDGNALGRALLKSLGFDYLNSGRPIVAADRASESDPCDAAMHKRLCWHRLGFATERLIR